jgi:2,5-diketo-D-gluconate reductase B
MTIPALGLGTSGLTGSDGLRAFEDALSIGYRHIDTAQRYGNEAEIGEAIFRSGIQRSDLFLTTKVWYTDYAQDVAPRLVQESLDKLKTDHVDLLLIHWPNPKFDLAQTVALFEEMRRRGWAKHIGVSNFPKILLQEAVELGITDLVLNQVEYHPFLNQRPMLALLRSFGMGLTAYMPLAKGQASASPIIRDIAAAHGKTPEQVTLRWLLQQDDVIVVPRSSKTKHLASNFEVFDFALSAEETGRINALANGLRLANPSWAPDWDPV